MDADPKGKRNKDELLPRVSPGAGAVISGRKSRIPDGIWEAYKTPAETIQLEKYHRSRSGKAKSPSFIAKHQSQTAR